MAKTDVRVSAKTGAVSYRVRFQDKGRTASVTFDDGKEAERFRKLVERVGPEQARRIVAAQLGTADADDSEDEPLTVAELVGLHIDGLTGIEDGTRSDYRHMLANAIAPTPLGAMPVELVSRGDVAAWINGQGSAGKTIKNRHSLLSAAFTTATRDGLRPDNPAKGHRLPKSATKDEQVFLTRREWMILLPCVPVHWRPFVMMLVGSGVRFSEATALLVRHFDLDNEATGPTVRIERAWKHTDGAAPKVGPPKTKRALRTIGLPVEVADAVRPLLAGKDRDELVFTGRQGQHILHPTFWEAWRTVIRHANDPKRAAREGRPVLGKTPRIHDLRHTHASWLISAGIPLTVIQRRLGHESIQTTSDTYGHLTAEAVGGATLAASSMMREDEPAPPPLKLVAAS